MSIKKHTWQVRKKNDDKCSDDSSINSERVWACCARVYIWWLGLQQWEFV